MKNNGDTDHHTQEENHDDKKSAGGRRREQVQKMPHMREGAVSAHIETRRKLKDMSLVADFDCVPQALEAALHGSQLQPVLV